MRKRFETDAVAYLVEEVTNAVVVNNSRGRVLNARRHRGRYIGNIEYKTEAKNKDSTLTLYSTLFRPSLSMLYQM